MNSQDTYPSWREVQLAKLTKKRNEQLHELRKTEALIDLVDQLGELTYEQFLQIAFRPFPQEERPHLIARLQEKLREGGYE